MSTHQENTTTNSKRPRGFIHSPNSSADLRVAGLRRLGGWEWYGIYIALLEVLFDSSDLHISRSRLEDVAFSLRVAGDTLEKVVAVCLESGALLEDAKGIYSPDLIDDVSQFELKREKFVKAARARYQKPATHGERESVAPAMHMQRSEDACRSHEYDTDTEYETETEIRSEAKEPTTPASASEEAPRDPLLADAEARLQAPGGQPWTQSNAWICAGRRPLKRFPLIFLTPQELIQALQQIRKSIPPDDVAGVFESCEARLRNKSPQQRDQVSAYNWLTGWCLEEAIDKATKRQRGKNSGVPVAPFVRAPQQQSAGPPSVAESEPRVSDEKAKEFIHKLKEATRCVKSIQ